MFKNIIARRPSKSLMNGITSNPSLGKPIYDKAIQQHDFYIETLKKCDVKIEVLDADEKFPDSCFVEDVAVCTSKFAIITSPGAKSRVGEEEEMKEVLKKYYDDIDFITLPGTLEGGDVMMVGDHYYIGLSDRTNIEGAKQFIKALESRGMEGSVIKMEEMLHLKTGLAYLEDNILLVAGEFIDMPEFSKYNKIVVPKQEEYAANSIRVNDYVIMPKGYPITKSNIEKAGLNVLEVDSSEFRKVDGGLSCLSLRF